MAKDYLTELKKFTDAGGKDINEFLKLHTVSQPGVTTVTPALTPSQPSSVAARLAAADSAERLGLGGVSEGNVITNRAARPITAESDALAARIQARAAGVSISASTSTPASAPASSTFAPTPRRTVPEFNTSVGGSAGANISSPWWQRDDVLMKTKPQIDENRFAEIPFITALDRQREDEKRRGKNIVTYNRTSSL